MTNQRHIERIATRAVRTALVQVLAARRVQVLAVRRTAALEIKRIMLAHTRAWAMRLALAMLNEEGAKFGERDLDDKAIVTELLVSARADRDRSADSMTGAKCLLVYALEALVKEA
jgi:hypothetical protein